MIQLPRACCGRTAVRFSANSPHMCCVELKGLASAGKGFLYKLKQQEKTMGFSRSLTDGYAMLMSPNKGRTAVHGCHCPRDMAVRMREVMAMLWVGVFVPLALIYWKLVINLPRECRGKTPVRFPANSSHMCCVELALDRLLSNALTSAVRDF